MNATDFSLCQICKDKDQIGDLILPSCECQDIQVFVHRSCLDRSLNKVCKTCGCEYEIECCGFKHFSEWWKLPTELEYIPLGEYYGLFLLFYWLYVLTGTIIFGPIQWYFSWTHKTHLVMGILVLIFWFKSILLFQWKDKVATQNKPI